MARSEEDTVVSVATDDEGNDYSPKKVYKPSTWTSQPGTHFPKYKWRRELSYEALQKELLDLERRRKAEGTKHSFKDGTYDVHTDLSQDTPPRHPPAKVLRKRVPTAETKHRHREQPAGTDASGTHSSESSDRDAVAD
ncbi:hypothetical protein MTO96_029503 [Rhipicephalus appendiculatus]